MMIPYFEAAPPYAPNAVEFPEDEAEAKQSWVQWPLSRDIRRTPLRTPLGVTVFPVAIHRAGTRLWLLETQDRADPRAVISNSDDLWFVLERERAKGPPTCYHFQLAEQDAVRYILLSGYTLPDDISLPQPAASVPPAGSDRTARTGPPEGEPDPAAVSAGKPPSISPPDRPTVGEYLADCIKRSRRVTARQVQDATGVPEGTVRGLQPWTEYRDHLASQQQPSKKAMTRAKSLPEEADSLIPGKDEDPTKALENEEAEVVARRIMTNADYREIVEREYLEDENAGPARKAEYHRMSRDEKLQQLVTWKALGMD